MAKVTTKERMEKKVDCVVKKVLVNNRNDRILDELKIIGNLAPDSEWELDETSFKGMSYEDSRQFIKLLQRNLRREINLTTNNFSWLQTSKIIIALEFTGNSSGLYKKNEKVKSILKILPLIDSSDIKELLNIFVSV